ncbi:MAG: phenylalanine--tRNA ligase subunit alpha [Nanoarchaeota archaeon]
MNKLMASLHPLERKLLPHLKENVSFDEMVGKSGMQEIEVMRALQWLENKGALKINLSVQEMVKLDTNGENYRKHGLPEIRLLKELSSGEKCVDDLSLPKEEVSISIGALKKKAAIDVAKRNDRLFLSITQNGKNLLEKESLEEKLLKHLPIELSHMSPEQKFAFDNLKSRKNIVRLEVVKLRTITLTALGKELSKEKIKDADFVDTLTPELLKSGEWKGKTIRPYDIKINVPKISSGRRHPYNESLNLIRKVFLEMGFQEMTGPWVETAFWCMDSMWIPQDHPARDVQDTFFLDRKGDLPDAKIVSRVKAAHENGLNTGSTGHTKKWEPEIARELLLRTHSTATTFRYFFEHKLNHDCKYFYIANNFRNEAVDATHLTEFGQAEGFIMGDNLSLADLMGFIKEFYAKLGITKIRFKPTFNPYTEPSMEAHYYNEKLGKWYALINSGIFRPEALAPYGITKSVIAWGMGSSRIAAILTGKGKLKDLLGPEVDFNSIKKHERVTTQ